MGYLVLARKWRPQTWDELVAQQHVTATLRNAIRQKRIAHAYLLTGPRGVGKTSAARILAKSLNCEKGPTPDPCNACSSCLEVTAGRAMDVVEIDGASNRNIDDIRNLRETVRYAPTRGAYKVYIIDEVHMLTNESFNALLKTLEEPPEHVVFLFATTEPHKVPATILSRCQRFDFHRVGVVDTAALLKKICAGEGIDIEEEAVHLIARKADGSLRDSQSILDQMVSFCEGRIGVDDVVRALGLIDQQCYFDLTDRIAARDADGALAVVDRLVESGAGIEEFLDGLAGHFRNLLVAAATGRTSSIELSDAAREKTGEQARSIREEELLRMHHVVSETVQQLRFSADPRIPLELAVVKMARLDRSASIDELLAGLAEIKKKPAEAVKTEAARSASPSPEPAGRVSGSPMAVRAAPLRAAAVHRSAAAVPQPVRRPEAPAAPEAAASAGPEPPAPAAPAGTGPAVSFENVKARWDDLLTLVKEKKITVGAFLAQGAPLRVREGVLEIGFALCNGFHVDSINRSLPIIQEALRETFGRDVPFRCVKGDFPEVRRLSEKEQKAQKLDELKGAGGVIGSLIEVFGAEPES
ncbi:DNA polymerase III subunit gamma/tau [bacterium]|nr:DNA polymerase III subunit gamma/tau [bacterium]